MQPHPQRHRSHGRLPGRRRREEAGAKPRQAGAGLGLALLLLLAGCGAGPDRWFPLHEGARWEYSLRAGFITRVEPIEAASPSPVAGATGWELTGPMGASRLAWVGDELVAAELAGTLYDPPITLLDASDAEAAGTWSGLVSLGADARSATATRTQTAERQELGGRPYSTIRSTLTFEYDNGTVTEMITWYAEGIGPLRQEQRDEGVLTRALEYQSGP